MTTNNNTTGKEVLNITYDGNKNETYTIFSNGKELGELSTDEDTVIAICNAVNETCGKGIDPTGVEEFIKAAVNVLNWHKAHEEISFIEGQAIERLETALKNIKL